MCIKVLGGSRRRFAQLGDVIVCSVKSVIPGSELKKKTVVRGVIVRVRAPTRRNDGSYVRFDTNAVVIIDKEIKTTIRVERAFLVRSLASFANADS